MNEPEFKDWYAYHRSAYPGIDSWLAKIQTAASRGAELTVGKVLGAWRRCLEDVDLRAAKAATDRLMRGDEDEPKSFDRHPQAVRRIAKIVTSDKQHKSACPGRWNPTIGEWTYDCPLCEDTGILTVYHGRSVIAMREGRYGEPGTSLTAAVKCTCQRGEQNRGSTSQYDPSRHCLYEAGTEEDEERRLREFCGRPPQMTAWTPYAEAPQP